MSPQQPPLSAHLAGTWWTWRDVAIRAAGFPFGDLLRLGNSELAETADASAGEAGFRDAYLAAIDDSCAVLAEIADGELFRTAILWQNREVVSRALDWYLERYRAGGERVSRQRKAERLLTKYVQRYHAKNESIGFFGPIGWARWADDHSPAVSELVIKGFHGDIADRIAQLETWAVRALAERFAADSPTRQALAPVVAPTIKIRDGRVRTPMRGWIDVPRPRIDVLLACDGQSTVAELTERLVAAGIPGMACAQDVERQLASLERAGYVSVGLRIPPTCHADRYLHRMLSQLPDPAVRERHLGVLEGVQAAADRVRLAGGDHRLLATALADLDATFTAATGTDSYRRTGDLHLTGRALLVEDCRSDLRASLGPALLANLAGPLSLVLASSRWLVSKVADRYLEILGEIFDGLVTADRAGVGLAAILPEFLKRCDREVLAGEAAPAIAMLQRHWSEILRIPPGASRHHVAVDDIAATVSERFAAPAAPWLAGRFHSPDLMLAAASVEAIARGDYTWVLGELHPAVNTLNQAAFMVTHPDQARAMAMADEDATRGEWLIPIYPSDWPEISWRDYPPPYLAGSRLEHVRVSAEPPRDGVTGPIVAISELTVIRDRDNALWLRHDDGRRRHPLALLGEILQNGLPYLFRPLAPAEHLARVSIGCLVLAREQWRVPAGELKWPALADEASRYLAARRWVRDLGLPRYVFVRVAGERKPFYVDFTSPLLVNMIAAAVRSAQRAHPGSSVTVSEMYPGPDELWVPHGPSASGGTCTSELRLAVVDRAEA